MLEESGKTISKVDRRFSVAPMMGMDRPALRFFHRLLTRKALLYTEMLTTAAILRGDRQRLLGFDAFEQPVALQLGGRRSGRRWRKSAHIGAISVTPRSISMSAARPTACRKALRRLPDDRAGFGRRLRAAMKSRCRNSRDREMPPSASTIRTRQRPCFHRRRREGCGYRCLDRACTQSLAEGLSRVKTARCRRSTAKSASSQGGAS